MFIIEGADGLGKTTAAKALVSLAAEPPVEYPVRYQHMGRPNEAFDFYDDYRDMISMFAVQDRFHLGGSVYHDAITQDQLCEINQWLLDVGSYVVIFWHSDIIVYAESLRRGTQKQLFSVADCTDHNVRFANLSAYADVLWDVANGYPSRRELITWLDAWYARLDRVDGRSPYASHT